MKQVLRMSKNAWSGAMDATNALLTIIDGYTVKSWKMVQGVVVLVDATGAEFGTTIWTDGADFFATPDWMLDWADYEWSGTSAKGQSFTIFNCEPMVD